MTSGGPRRLPCPKWPKAAASSAPATPISSKGTRRRARARSQADFTPGAGEAGFEEEGGVVAKAPSSTVEDQQLVLEQVLQLGIRGDVSCRLRCGRRRAVCAARQAQRPVGQRAHRSDAQAV